jgi:hypothetical protein
MNPEQPFSRHLPAIAELRGQDPKERGSICPTDVSASSDLVLDVAAAKRVADLRSQLRRINGHKSWSPKQEAAALRLAREIVSIEGTDGSKLWKRKE